MSPTTPPTVAHPLRILHLSPSGDPIPPLLQGLYPEVCGTVPSETLTSAGDTLHLSTSYYTAAIPLWHDTLPLSASSIAQWRTEWLADEAREVIHSIGAWVVGARKPAWEQDLVRYFPNFRPPNSLWPFYCASG